MQRNKTKYEIRPIYDDMIYAARQYNVFTSLKQTARLLF